MEDRWINDGWTDGGWMEDGWLMDGYCSGATEKLGPSLCFRGWVGDPDLGLDFGFGDLEDPGWRPGLDPVL